MQIINENPIEINKDRLVIQNGSAFCEGLVKFEVALAHVRSVGCGEVEVCRIVSCRAGIPLNRPCVHTDGCYCLGSVWIP